MKIRNTRHEQGSSIYHIELEAESREDVDMLDRLRVGETITFMQGIR